MAEKKLVRLENEALLDDYIEIPESTSLSLEDIQKLYNEEHGLAPRKRRKRTKGDYENQISFDLDSLLVSFVEEKSDNPLDLVDELTRSIIDDIVLEIDFNNVDAALDDENGWARKKKGEEGYINALQYAIQKQAVEVDPSNIFLFTYPVHKDILCQAIEAEPELLRFAIHYGPTFVRRLYESVPDSILKGALEKNGMLVKYIPSSRLKAAKDNILCVTAVKQNPDAFYFVPKGVGVINDKLEEVGRVDKNNPCLDDNVIDAYLSHSSEDKTMYRALSEHWINENILVKALEYNFESIETMVEDYKGVMTNTRKGAPDINTIGGSRDVVSELKPEILNVIKEKCIEKPSRFSLVPSEIRSPKLIGDLACAGISTAKIAFSRLPLEIQFDYLQSLRDNNELRGRDYSILRTDNWLILSIVPEEARDVIQNNRPEIYNEMDSSMELLRKYNAAIPRTIDKANLFSILESHPDIFSDLVNFRNLTIISGSMKSYSDFTAVTLKKARLLIRHFDWQYEPSRDAQFNTWYENEKFNIAYDCVSKEGSMIKEVYEYMFPNGIHSYELESKINDLAVHKSPRSFRHIPNPSRENTLYACEAFPRNVMFADVRIMGKQEWDNCAISCVKEDPSFIANLDYHEGCDRSFLIRAEKEVPSCVEFMTESQRNILHSDDGDHGGSSGSGARGIETSVEKKRELSEELR